MTEKPTDAAATVPTPTAADVKTAGPTPATAPAPRESLDARHELEEASDRGNDAHEHADVHHVLHAGRGQADDGGDEQEERQQREEQIGDVLVLLNLDVVLGCHEVLTAGLGTLERELDDQAADRDSDDGTHDTHDGCSRERDAAAIGRVDPCR